LSAAAPSTAARPPLVTVIVPALDEERSIAECLEAIRAQDWPAGSLEVLVALGPSADRTPEIVARCAAGDPRVRVLDNPGGRVARALNLGIAAARGEIVVRIDAHTIPAPDYVRRSIESLQATGADVVGGRMEGRGSTRVGRAMALAMRHAFGVGTARFRFARGREEVDTVYLGAFPRTLFDRLGGYNEALVRNQDYELAWRVRRAGGRIVVDPAIRSTYVTRSTLGAIFRQYHDYGYWKLRMLRLHPRSLRPRQLVAPLWVAALAGSAGLALAAALGRAPAAAALLLPGLAALYTAAAVGVALVLGRRAGTAVTLALPLVFATLHFAWGSGFLRALLGAPPPGSRAP
jgi:glycosyltransferase involved in cell wall biosynthesis